jgi:putative ABC transport system permease protein
MIQNYLKVILRNIFRYKGYSFINIFGLTIGIVCFVLIALFVLDELSYDRYHEKADRIYKVGISALVNDTEIHGNLASAPFAFTLLEEYPEVEAVTRIKNFGFPVLRYNDKAFSEERWYYADSTFFDVFTVPFLQGNPNTALTQPYSVVLSHSMAQKYFGDEDPMGKIINSDNYSDFLVTGVFEDVPHNSHFHYDFLASMCAVEDSRNQMWLSNNYHTYFVLNEATSPEEFEVKIQALAEKYVFPIVAQIFGTSVDQLLADGAYFRYRILPMTDIHLRSQLEYELEPNSDIRYVYIFSIIAVAILLIACVNFINLATARSTRRAKEIGIRKTVGSSRHQLVRQFLAETIALSFLAVLLALPIIEILIPLFNNLTGKELSLSFLQNFYTIPILLGITILVGFVAGTYPALYMASFDPVRIMKGESIGNQRKSRLRSVLVVFQFAVSIALIIGTVSVYRQLEFIQNMKLGFQPEQVIVIKKTDDLGKQIDPFMKELSAIPGVVSVSKSERLIGTSLGDDLYRSVDEPPEDTHIIWALWTDNHFAETYRMNMVQGSYFLDEVTDLQDKVVVNQSAVEAFGLTDPIGKKIVDTNTEQNEFTIVGVVEDFHFASMHHQIKPLLIHSLSPDNSAKFTSVRIGTGNINAMLASFKDIWHKYALNQAFEFEFFDEHFAKIYLAEEKTGQIFMVFTTIAILITSMGLFGLAAFVTQQRTKEIGIRKVLGANLSNIIGLLSKEFLILVVLANIIAIPIAYYAMNKWLANFAYHTEISLLIFLLAAALALIIAMISVSFQAIKAAVANPVDSLKYE